MNEATKQPAMNLRLARVYLQHSDPAFSSRSWQDVMDEAAKAKRGEAQKRWIRGMKEKPFPTNDLKQLIGSATCR